MNMYILSVLCLLYNCMLIWDYIRLVIIVVYKCNYVGKSTKRTYLCCFDGLLSVKVYLHFDMCSKYFVKSS